MNRYIFVIYENYLIREMCLGIALLIGMSIFIFSRKIGFYVISQVHRSTRLLIVRVLIERLFVSAVVAKSDLRIVGRAPTYSPESFFGTRIMVLKEPVSTAEKGVLYIMFSELIQDIPNMFNMRMLLSDYNLVLEPSWSGYCDAGLLQYIRYGQDVFVLGAEERDFNFLQGLKSNLVPIKVGPCDWVDPRVCEEFLGAAKRFEIVMNAHWGQSKRHYVLFKALSGLSPDIRVALIGVPWMGRGMEDISRLAAQYGVLEQLTFFERIPYSKVMQICCESKVGILLSLKEGSNRAISEMMFCDIPVILLSSHVGGIRKNIVPETGTIVDEKVLSFAIGRMLENLSSYSPRRWALTNISCFVTSGILNSMIRHRTIARGYSWTKDIVCRSNSPESRYCNNDEKNYFEQYNKSLARYLL